VTAAGELGRMRDARRGVMAAYGRVRRSGLATYWLGLVYAVVLFGGGIAGLALGHRNTGTIGLILGGFCLLAGLRDLLRRRRAPNGRAPGNPPVAAGRTPASGSGHY
jgi:hypothetical protein